MEATTAYVTLAMDSATMGGLTGSVAGVSVHNHLSSKYFSHQLVHVYLIMLIFRFRQGT